MRRAHRGVNLLGYKADVSVELVAKQPGGGDVSAPIIIRPIQQCLSNRRLDEHKIYPSPVRQTQSCLSIDSSETKIHSANYIVESESTVPDGMLKNRLAGDLLTS